MANINSVITYNANLSPAQAQIKALTGQIAGLSAAFNTLDKAALSAQKSLASGFAANVGQIGGFTAQTVKANDAVTSFGKQIAANRLTMREYFREAITGYTRQQSMLRQLAAQQVRYQQSIAVSTGPGQSMMLTPQSIDAVASKTALASQRFSIFNELIDGGATKMLNWGKNTQWAGRQLMVGFTLPLALFTATLSKQFRELDKELTRFQKVYGADLGGAVTESTTKMREQVKQLAFDISQAYGIAAKDTAALAADIAATGKEGETLMASVEQTTRLAVLGEVDRQEAMKATLSLQSAFRMNTNELAESINFLNAVENQTSATLEDLATAIPKVGPVVRSLGGDVRDLATLLVAMREGGIPAAEAANALKSGLASLINPTKQASEVAKSFGVDLVGIVEANRGQLMPTIYAMQEALSGLDSFSRSRIIEQIFGKYQFARITALFDNIGRVGSQTQSVIELASKSSAELAAVANQEMRTLTESTAVKFQRTLEQLKNSLMPIGQVLTESLIPVLDAVGKGMQAFSTFFSSLPESVQSLAKWTVALTAVAGPVIMLVGLFGNLIANGLKFGMMVVRLGAKITGLKTEKFELLDHQVMAAKLGVDSLTTSFTTQETALKRLTGVLSAYETSLRRLTASNPALFIPGAAPASRNVSPIRRQSGSKRPEYVPGTGRGDSVPALLEPGEFIVNRNAASKFGPILSQMNSGKFGRYQEGGLVRAHISSPGTVSLQDPATMAALRQISTGYARQLIEAMAQSGVQQMKVYSNLVLMLTESTNKLLTDSSARERLSKQEIRQQNQSLISQMRSQQAWQLIMDQTGLSFEQLQPFIREVTVQLDRLGNELIDDPILYEKVDVALSKLVASGDSAARTLQILGSQYGAFQTMSVGPGGTRAGRRQAFGPTTAGVPGYTQLKPGVVPKIPLQERVPTTQLPGFFISGMSRGAATATGSASPSRMADRAGETTGVNIGTGAINGLKRGLSEATSGKKTTGPGSSLAAGRAMAQDPRGMGAMNAMFTISMIASSVSMLGGASNEAASKLGLFTTALMTATMLMNTGLGKSSLSNFLGMGSLGNKLKAAGAARAAGTMGMGTPLSPLSMGVGKATGAGAAMKIPGGLTGAGAGLARAGGMLSMLGGPVGIAAGIGITGAITAFMMYKQAAEEARQRAISAFSDPVKTAEYFGVTVTKLSDQIKNAQIELPGIENIDASLREAVQADYGDLITKIQYGGAEAGAEELSIAFNRMIASGMDAESAKEAVKAISAEAGVVGGQAYSQALREGMLDENLTAGERLTANVEMLKPMEKDSEGVKAMQSTLDSYVESLDTTGFERWAAQNLNNVAGDFLSGTLSTLQNINPLMQGFRAVIGATMGETEAGRMFEMTFDKDAIQQNTDMMAAQADTIHQMSTNIEENLKVTGDQLVKMTEQAYAAFQTAPKAAVDAMAQLSEYATELGTEGVGAIEEFITSISPIEGAILNSMVAGDEGLQKLVLQGISAGMTVSEIIETLQTQGAQGIQLEIDVRVKDQEAKIALDNLKRETSEDIVQVVDVRIERSETALKELDDAINRVTRSRDRGLKKMEEDFQAEQEGYSAAIEAHQDQIDLINEETEARREVTEEKIDSLEKEKESINNAADTYIKSLQKRQKADSFYAQQRKTSLSALQKLASGDVFGFLQDRQQMSADAQEFSYEKEISGIEERRDLEVDAIDRTIKKERERQERFEKNQEKKIDLLEDEIDKINDVSDARQKAHETEMKDFETLKNEKIKELNREKRDEQTKLGELKKMRESANNQEIISARDLADTLGPELAKPYIEKQKEIIKGMYLAELARLKEEGETDMSPADALLREMYALLVGKQSADQMSNDALKAWLATIPNSRRSDNSTDVPSGRDRSQNRASGGKIVGPGGPKSDVIPALLSNGEYVIQASSVNKYGTQLMDEINAGRFAGGGKIRKYAKGGSVQLDENLLKQEGISLGTAKRAVRYIASGGWPENLMRLAYTIAMRESNGNPNAFSRYSPTNSDTGLFQINEAAYGRQPWFDLNKLKDPIYNAAMAYKHVSRKGSFFLPWALTPNFNGKTGWDWAYYDGSSVFAPGSDARNETIRRTELFWNSFKGYKGGKDNAKGNKSGKRSPEDPASIEARPASNKTLAGILSLIGQRVKPGDGRKPGRPGNEPSSSAQKALEYAKKQVGKPYSLNAQPPDSWDCSKLTAWSWNETVGKNILTPYSHTQATELRKRTVGLKNGKITGLSVGDILYFKTEGPSRGHTSMYAGGDKIVNASSPSVGVVMSDLNTPWNTGINALTGKPRFQWAGPPKGYAAGGFISGPGGPRSDSIPAMLSNGEYVIKASSVAKYGKGFMDKINAGQFGMGGLVTSSGPKLMPSSYADGGFVGSMSDAPMPTFGVPEVTNISPSEISSNMNNFGGSTNSSTSNTSNVKVIINAANNKSARAIANKVISIINEANGRRNHSRSI